MASTNLSRLDQVFTLLESGASAVTRKAAAKQLGDVQKKHPTELNNLLAKLLPYLRHTEWETRIASVEAIQALVEQVPAWQTKNDTEQMECDSVNDEHKSLLQFMKFDVDKLLSCSETLLGSSGEEMNISLDPNNQAEQVKKQRKYLEKSLGLHTDDSGIDMGFSSKALFKDEDLIVKEEPVIKNEKVKETCEVVMGKMFENMSRREKNLAKRKAKQMSKQRNRYRNDEKDQPARKQRKFDTDGNKTNDSLASASYFLPEDIPKHLPEPENWSEWPFKWFYENLLDLLFNSAWESRHGSCMAIRVLLKHHAATLGKKSNQDEQTNDLGHEQALEDLAIRLLSVISLDRFADYVSDQVVAPVRESCAQALSVVTTFMKPESVFSVVRILLHLRSKDEWQLRASAVVTLQYIIAVRKEIMTELLSMCLNDIVSSLSDGDGDVRSAAAKCLMPTTHVLLDNQTYEPFVTSLLEVLWESLLDFDELTASTHSVMLLLSNIISLLPKNKIIDKGAAHTEGLVTRLWPFLMHVDEAVRKAAVTTFFTVLNAQTDQNEKIGWSDQTCTDAIVNLFCSCLFDKSDQVQQQTLQAFLACLRKCGKSAKVMAVNNFPYWLILTSQPSHSTFDSNYLASVFSMLSLNSEVRDDAERYIGGMAPSTCNQHSSLLHVTRTRIRLAKMIGALCWHSFPEVGGEDAGSLAEVEGTRFTVDYFEQTLLSYLQSQTSLHQTVASFTLKGAWEEALHLEQIEVWMSLQLRQRIDNLLIQNFYYTEITATIMELQSDVKNFMLTLNKRGFTETLSTQFGFSLDEVVSVCSNLNEEKLRSASASATTTTASSSSVNKQKQQGLAEQRDFIMGSAENTNKWFASLDNQCKSAGASVVVQSALSIEKLGAAEHDQHASVWMLPSKLNSIIRPLMDTIKREENLSLVDCACDSISQLLGLCAARQPSPNNKLVKNLTVSLTSQLDAYPTLQYITSKFSKNVLSSFKLTRDNVANDGVITILRQRSVSDVTSGRRCSYKNTRQQLDASSTHVDVTSRNAASCLRRICEMYGSKVFQVAPMMLELVNNLKASHEDSMEASIGDDDSKNKSIIHGLALLKVILPALKDEELITQVLKLLPEVMQLLYHKRSNVRFVTSSCLATLASSHPSLVLPTVVDHILPEFDSDDFTRRRGSVEAVANMVSEMGPAVVSYAVLLVVPLLGKMGDNLPQVRLMATSCFARLIQYIPVESSIPDPIDMPHELVQRKRHERRFLEQLFDSKSLEDYPVPITINAQLRSYQQDGVKWLAFLNRYKLHGILCDDMGLGKTLQTICIMASDHYHKEQKAKTKKKKDKKNLQNHLVSLVICPPTLTGHWVEETKRFCSHLNPLHYTGVPNERVKLQDEVAHHNMVVASYEVVRNDISFFSKFCWNYCVLDEGHMIRNGKSKTSQSVKTLVANHRLILTGTPIQNNVLELWSLFDFLIPGFLGTEHEFTARFTKPIVASREAKSSSKEQEMGLLAMNALHRQVLPFMLRRMKEDVLKDLPPKIVQDYYCDLTPLQMELYEDFAKSRAKKVAENSIKEFDYEDEEMKSASNNKTSHVFQALQYLQKVCNHPAFVLTPNHPHYSRISDKLKRSNNKLHDIANSCKLVALKQLLLDCGIGGEASSSTDALVVSQHRALIFCLHKNMLDVIENHLFKPHMPAVTYLRLDGSVPTNQRFSTVSRFNNDPSIDVLLLSTRVGGLGLNLTGADTVIFVEHDWNPTTDIQAMDRAHRIGQKKVVNVYRIITRGTLEEKILGLQKFKLKLANTIVSEDNRALSSMGTSQVLDLFNVGQINTGSSSSSRRKNVVENSSASRGLKSMIDGLSELWDQSQYEDQYNLDNFIKSMQ